MKAATLPRLAAVLGAAALWTLMSPAPAAAIVCTTARCLDFTELGNEGGITATETTSSVSVVVGSLTVSGETISLFNREVGDTGSFNGIGSPAGHIFNLLEPDGSISDQVIVFAACSVPESECGSDGIRVMFTSDPARFNLGTPDLSTIEDGTRQLVGSYLGNFGGLVSVYVTSDVDPTVPQPASLALLAVGLAGLGFWRRAVKT